MREKKRKERSLVCKVLLIRFDHLAKQFPKSAVSHAYSFPLKVKLILSTNFLEMLEC